MSEHINGLFLAVAITLGGFAGGLAITFGIGWLMAWGISQFPI